jgi:hypothetical protein
MMLRLLIVVASILAVTGCAGITEPLGMKDPFAIPQPFQGVERNDAMVNQAILVSALVVEPPQGLTEEVAVLLRDQVVEAARQRDVPAFGAPTAMAWVLKGQMATISATGAPGSEQRIVSWQLFDPEGNERTQFPVTFSGGDDVLMQGGTKLLAEQTANALEIALARPRTQIVEQQAPAARPVVAVAGVKGAPGDGNTALAEALRAVLPLKGVMVDAKKGAAAWRIEGVVEVARGPGDNDTVTLTWRVLDAKGKEAGTITQENAVPRGRLNKPWAEVAGFAAEAAAEGIAQLLQQIAQAKPA